MKSIACLISAFLIISIISCSSQSNELDILIKGGKIIDGNNQEAFTGDIGIVADSIVFIGNANAENLKAKKTIDASGLTVTPGFIDPHTHALGDLQSEERNQNINYLTQGVTTVFVGNDGRGPIDIDKVAEKLEKGIGTNVAFFVGHGTIRLAVLGDEDVAPNKEELDEMRAFVKKGMETGAFGLSTGLYYFPGSFSETEEVIELTKVIVPYNGIYESHIRDESSYNIGLINSVKETIRIGEESGAPVHFSHIKALGVDVWGKSTEVIQLVEEAQSRGVKVTGDQYPWKASGTSIRGALVNRWVSEGGAEQYMKRINDEKILPRIRAEIKENIRRRGGAESLLISAGAKDKSMIGLTLAEISEKMELDPVETALAIERNGGASVASFNMNEDDIINFMKQDWIMTSSDGSTGHPRKFASFPEKYQRYVKEKQVLTLVNFIHKSSALTASTIGVERRGSIEMGNFADIIVFSEDDFKPNATFSEPRLLSEGVMYVLVNGELAIENGEPTENLSGRVLRKNE